MQALPKIQLTYQKSSYKVKTKSCTFVYSNAKSNQKVQLQGF